MGLWYIWVYLIGPPGIFCYQRPFLLQSGYLGATFLSNYFNRFVYGWGAPLIALVRFGRQAYFVGSKWSLNQVTPSFVFSYEFERKRCNLSAAVVVV